MNMSYWCDENAEIDVTLIRWIAEYINYGQQEWMNTKCWDVDIWCVTKTGNIRNEYIPGSKTVGPIVEELKN